MILTLALTLSALVHADQPRDPRELLVETHLIACDRAAVVVRVMSPAGRSERRTFVRDGRLIETHFQDELSGQHLDLRFEWRSTAAAPRLILLDAPLGFAPTAESAGEILADFQQHAASCASRYPQPATSHFYWN